MIGIDASQRRRLTHSEVHLELDREVAIRTAVLEASVDDVVVIAGKGHETTQLIAGVSREFSDARVASRACRERGSA